MNQKLVTALIAAGAALVTGVLGAVLGYMSNNRQMDVKMVEIAVGILGQEPKDNIAPAREWAVDVIEHYAEVKPSAAVRAALVNNKVVRNSYDFYDYVSAPKVPPPQH